MRVGKELMGVANAVAGPGNGVETGGGSGSGGIGRRKRPNIYCVRLC